MKQKLGFFLRLPVLALGVASDIKLTRYGAVLHLPSFYSYLDLEAFLRKFAQQAVFFPEPTSLHRR